MVVQLSFSQGIASSSRSNDVAAKSRNSDSVAKLSGLSIRATEAKSISEEATSTDTSATSNANKRATVEALSALSNASSFVSEASNATDEVKSLLEKAYSIAGKLEDNLDPTGSLAAEGASLLQEIDSVVSKAEVHGQSVVNAGEKIFSVKVDGSDNSGNSDIGITVANVAISRSDLSLDGITASDFSSDPTATLSTIDDAINATRLESAKLSDTSRQISSAASEFGLYVQTGENADGLDFQKASKLAGTISDALTKSSLDLNPELTSSQIENLLSS